MKILLDTHVWIWWISTPEVLSRQARSRMSNLGNELFLSAASSLEIAIKHALGKLKLPEAPSEYVPKSMAKSRVSPLAIQHSHALRVSQLPLHHRDPFDRLLIAQAQIEALPILTADPWFAAYDVRILKAR